MQARYVYWSGMIAAGGSVWLWSLREVMGAVKDTQVISICENEVQGMSSRRNLKLNTTADHC